MHRTYPERGKRPLTKKEIRKIPIHREKSCETKRCSKESK